MGIDVGIMTSYVLAHSISKTISKYSRSYLRIFNLGGGHMEMQRWTWICLHVKARTRLTLIF